MKPTRMIHNKIAQSLASKVGSGGDLPNILLAVTSPFVPSPNLSISGLQLWDLLEEAHDVSVSFGGFDPSTGEQVGAVGIVSAIFPSAIFGPDYPRTIYGWVITDSDKTTIIASMVLAQPLLYLEDGQLVFIPRLTFGYGDGLFK